MKLHKNLRQHHEIGSFATRTLWIPAVASILAVSFLVVRAPRGDGAEATAVASAHAAAPVAPAAPSLDVVRQLPEAALVPPDEAVTAHQLLDPVGAGHDVAR